MSAIAPGNRGDGRRVFVAAILLVLLLVPTPMLRAAPLVADLSNHLIAITTDFTGTDVLLFGAVDGPGDVVVVVRGPVTDVAVRRKGRIAGVWVNRDSVEFVSVPSFYAVASTRPLDEVMDEATRRRHTIGLDTLQFALMPGSDVDETDEFRAALERIKMRQLLYWPNPIEVNFLGDTLFRTDIWFPSNVPIGSYVIEVLLVRDGAVVSAQTTPLVISKIGIGADVFEWAHRQSLLYGLATVAMALLAGWIAHLVFRRI
ncbi:MAG: TIGR02186 family protein [Rhodospirillaceae bacterium]|nr:TIGR02186 family protein [Rhodospirillaceae bacterium]